MKNSVQIEAVQDLIVELRGRQVMIDADVAKLYGVETKRINEAVRNNPDKFPADYMFRVIEEEFNFLRSKFSSAKFAKTRTAPKAFTEKGLYMLATILKSKKAVEATFGIIETFTKIRELTRTVKALSLSPEKAQQKSLMQKSGRLIAEVLDDGLVTKDSETTIRKLPAVAHVLITLLNTKNMKRPEFGTRTSAPVKARSDSFAPLITSDQIFADYGIDVIW